MEQSVGSTIEKIKLQEQDIEAKLKEKREYEAALSSLNRAIRDALTETEKFDQQRLQIENRITKLLPQSEVEKIKRNALVKQINTFTASLENLRAQCDQGITNVWNMRSSLCDKVHNVSDECDIWALLMRPIFTDLLPQETTKHEKNDGSGTGINDDRLKAALVRKQKAMTEREKLLAEPETGEEFVRIKNALRYSREKIAYLNH